MPGYLRINNLNQKIIIDEDVGKGKTARIVKVKLTDPALISISKGFEYVAIKYIEDRVSRDSFRYEIAIMSMLPVNHPNIVKLIGYSDSPRCLVLKFYETSLDKLLSQPNFERSQSNISHIVSDIAKGMKAIHEKEVVHFDLKPQNVLVDVQSDSTCNYVICDFGYANFVSDGKRQRVAGMKEPETMGMTIRYAAPEVSYSSRLQNSLEFLFRC